MKKQDKDHRRKLRLHKETLINITDVTIVHGAGSENRLCAGYTEIIGPCIPTQHAGC